jgi:hypothetical protein
MVRKRTERVHTLGVRPDVDKESAIVGPIFWTEVLPEPQSDDRLQ